MTITKSNTSYQYLRLNDGKEIFAMVKEVDDRLELHFPMNIVCKTAMTGGVTIHLGPFVPFTTDDSMIIDSSEVMIRTSITDQFIDLYDQSITSWLDMRDNGGIEIKLAEDERESQGISIRKLLQEKIQNSIPDDFWDEYEQENMIGDYELPSKKDIIH